MYAVIRHYTGAPGFGAELTKRRNEIETIISNIDGFVAYELVQTEDGCATITVCDQRAGCEESTRRAAEWMKQNMPNLTVNPPQIVAGEVGIHLRGSAGAARPLSK